MKYHIDTIPIWDAYHENSECPLCLLFEKNEAAYVDSFLGGSVMEPETRTMTNEQGFCQHHLHQLYEAKLRHPLALMIHTHLKEVMGDLNKDFKALEHALTQADGLPMTSKAINSISGKGPDANAAAGLEAHLKKQQDSCILCGNLDRLMNRYAFTIGHLWHTDKEFNQLFTASRGFCQPHFALMLNVNRSELPLSARRPFIKALLTLQRENLVRIEGELAWYIDKMDYNKRDLPWGTSKDALLRTLMKLRGSTYQD